MELRTYAPVRTADGRYSDSVSIPQPSGVLVFLISFVQFLFYRSIHLWDWAALYARACIFEPTFERRTIQICFIIRYVSLPVNTYLTYLAMVAARDGDDASFRKYIYWGLIPSAVRTLSAAWTSTLDRQTAKDQEALNALWVEVISYVREQLKLPNDVRFSGGKLYQFLARSGFVPPTLPMIPTPRKLFRRYTVLAKFIEVPLNYVIQKLSLLYLTIDYFVPCFVPHCEFIMEVCRWARMITTVVLAPLNQYLGTLRIDATRQIEQEYLDLLVSDLSVLYTIILREGVLAEQEYIEINGQDVPVTACWNALNVAGVLQTQVEHMLSEAQKASRLVGTGKYSGTRHAFLTHLMQLHARCEGLTHIIQVIRERLDPMPEHALVFDRLGARFGYYSEGGRLSRQPSFVGSIPGMNSENPLQRSMSNMSANSLNTASEMTQPLSEWTQSS